MKLLQVMKDDDRRHGEQRLSGSL